MPNRKSHEAAIPNPALKTFDILVGEWQTFGHHPYAPGTTFHGRTEFSRMEGGAFLVMHSEIDEPGIPTGIAIFGSDNASGELSMLYFDEREVSRIFEVSFDGKTMKWWRNFPDFSQRITLTIAEDGESITSRGEMSRDAGITWEKDLELNYKRLRKIPGKWNR